MFRVSALRVLGFEPRFFGRSEPVGILGPAWGVEGLGVI